MRSFAPGAVATIALWKSAPMAVATSMYDANMNVVFLMDVVVACIGFSNLLCCRTRCFVVM